MNDNKISVYLVDDDAVFLTSMELQFLEIGDYEVNTFATGELCVEALSTQHNPDLIILDYMLNGVNRDAMNGLKTLDIIKSISPDIPVVVISIHDKIEIAVACMRHQAYDYVVKSETAFMRLQRIISNIFNGETRS